MGFIGVLRWTQWLVLIACSTVEADLEARRRVQEGLRGANFAAAEAGFVFITCSSMDVYGFSIDLTCRPGHIVDNGSVQPGWVYSNYSKDYPDRGNICFRGAPCALSLCGGGCSCGLQKVSLIS